MPLGSAQVIRETMDQVENFARFRFAKDSSCYVDILRHYFNNINRSDLNSKIPDLNLWLEFGVSQTTQLSLLSLGLSRNTAIAISEFITKSSLTKDECLIWLRDADLEDLGLSSIMIEDVNKVI